MEEIIAFIAGLTLNTLIPCALILAGGIYAILLIMKLFDKALAKSKLEKAVHPLLRTLLKILLFLLLGFILASKLGVDVSGMLDQYGALGAMLLDGATSADELYAA